MTPFERMELITFWFGVCFFVALAALALWVVIVEVWRHRQERRDRATYNERLERY